MIPHPHQAQQKQKKPGLQRERERGRLAVGMEETMAMKEEEVQQLRSRATELLLREDWRGYIGLYTQFISLCLRHLPSPASSGDPAGEIKLQKILCGALSNRAEARLRIRDLHGALDDCDRALALDPSHLKSLVCRGKTLLGLDRYAAASECLRRALTGGSGGGASSEALRCLFDRCRRLEAQSKTGGVDLSEWVLSGFKGDAPELAEYVGPVEIRRSEDCGGGRGLFATRNVEAGTLLVVTKAVVIGRGILPEQGDYAGAGGEAAGRLAMWKDFVERLLDAASRCRKTLQRIYSLSTGEDEGSLSVPDMRLFRPEQSSSPTAEAEGCGGDGEIRLDTGKILKILDVNCLTENAPAAKVLGKNMGGGAGGFHQGVGLWILASFVNHSCNPNARRLHVGDHLLIHASRDVKAGEEITFPYVDVLAPLTKRRAAMAGTWGFRCGCPRCRFEEATAYPEEMRALEEAVVPGCGADLGEVAAALEEKMARRWAAKGKQKGFLRASFWGAYSATYASERAMRKWERRLPAGLAAGESVAEAVGGDERVLKVAVEGMMRKKRKGGGGEVEVGGRVVKMARGVYGKAAKKQAAVRALLDVLS